ncbi:Crp/Fnr family transcriptional regulator [Chitinophaga agrisoli]|uniref:Crp/Fnr family transcriptional regulator n=1 Tax=Chitinophaga agrisoli TaxID=2607653 RepID=A0A5B2W210_9BACT|nr:Crp/Fnr family transcriptional regulator [Chitinophaga agrisoli]KAA2244712.1 Crp/Fnr family transcriptional regulator [Chitinophaga agrisoli]
MPQTVINFLDTIYPMSGSLKATISESLICKTFPKRFPLLEEGQVCKNIWFIKKGLVRAYYQQDDNEVTSWFMKENDVIISVSSFFDQLPSHEYIKTIERTEVAYISYDKLEAIYGRFLEFNIVGRIITQKYYTLWDKYIRDLRMQTSKERYLTFLQQYPDLVSRVPAEYLASFLGMTASTLSRIKAEQGVY